MSVFRYDVGKFKEPTITPQGYLKVDAYVTRVGVFKYRKQDGTLVREFRSPDEVFKAESLQSLAEIPITDDHPEVMLSAANTRQFARGFTGKDVSKDGIYLKTPMTITDAETIKKVMAQGKRETSSGYHCDIDPTPGEWEGEQYDCKQKDIRYNHVAIVDAGRAGPEVRLRMDSNDAMQVEEVKDAVWSTEYINNLPDAAFAFIQSGGSKDDTGKTVPRSLRHFPHHNPNVKNGSDNDTVDRVHLVNALQRAPQSEYMSKVMPHLMAHAKAMGIGEYAKKDDKHNKEDKFMVKITLNGVTYEVEDGLGRAMMDSLSKKDEDITKAKTDVAELTKKRDELQGKFDTASTTITEKDKKIAELEKKPSRADSLKVAKERLALEAIAKSELGDDAKGMKFDDMDDIAIKKAVLVKKNPTVKMDGQTDEYINGAFSGIATPERVDEASKKLAETLSGSAGEPEDRTDANSARAKHTEMSANRWKGVKK